MGQINFTEEQYKEASLGLLIDVLATNMDILDRLDAMYDFDFSDDYDENENRKAAIQYLESKYGGLPESLSDFLKTKGIDKPNK
tara:strand:- start:6086 stop:6337 length:252 start_codon:yes stop_codon:yes gene_type:complete